MEVLLGQEFTLLWLPSVMMLSLHITQKKLRKGAFGLLYLLVLETVLGGTLWIQGVGLAPSLDLLVLPLILHLLFYLGDVLWRRCWDWVLVE